jgi:glutathione peroxidase-family protein
MCLAYRYPRDAMMLRAPETEALYEGYAQKGFGVLGIDGSPFPRAQPPPMNP